jgi:hypothetical protein
LDSFDAELCSGRIVCKRGVVLVCCVKELNSLIMYLLDYSSVRYLFDYKYTLFYEKFRTGIRSLREKLKELN